MDDLLFYSGFTKIVLIILFLVYLIIISFFTYVLISRLKNIQNTIVYIDSNFSKEFFKATIFYLFLTLDLSVVYFITHFIQVLIFIKLLSLFTYL